MLQGQQRGFTSPNASSHGAVLRRTPVEEVQFAGREDQSGAAATSPDVDVHAHGYSSLTLHYSTGDLAAPPQGPAARMHKARAEMLSLCVWRMHEWVSIKKERLGCNCLPQTMQDGRSQPCCSACKAVTGKSEVLMRLRHLLESGRRPHSAWRIQPRVQSLFWSSSSQTG